MGTKYIVATDKEILIDAWKYNEILLDDRKCRLIAMAVLEHKEIRVCNDGNACDWTSWVFDELEPEGKGEIAEENAEWEEQWLSK